MTGSSAPLYRRDPEAYQAYLAEGNATQARKRVGADALLRDQEGRVLLVNPSYKEGWDLPGGMAEANESPADCVIRELREELALDVSPGMMLCADWVPPHGAWDDQLAFIFDCGLLTDGQIASLQLTDGELEAFEMCTVTEASGLLRPRLWRRLQAAIRAASDGCVRYLHDGERWPGLP